MLVSVVSVVSFRSFRSFRPFRFVVSGFSTCLASVGKVLPVLVSEVDKSGRGFVSARFRQGEISPSCL